MRRRRIVLRWPYSLERFLKIVDVCHRVIAICDDEDRRGLISFANERDISHGFHMLPVHAVFGASCLSFLEEMTINFRSDAWNEFQESLPSYESFRSLKKLEIYSDTLLPSMVEYFQKWRLLEKVNIHLYLSPRISPLPENGTFEGLPGKLGIVVHVGNFSKHTQRSQQILKTVARSLPLKTIFLVLARGKSKTGLAPWPGEAETRQVVVDILRARFPDMEHFCICDPNGSPKRTVFQLNYDGVSLKTLCQQDGLTLLVND